MDMGLDFMQQNVLLTIKVAHTRTEERFYGKEDELSTSTAIKYLKRHLRFRRSIDPRKILLGPSNPCR